MESKPQPNPMRALEGTILVPGARLYMREIGVGHPVLVLHGGPDFSHDYFIPDLDRLADLGRLIYYDQRGRGRSAGGVRPEDVTLASEVEDLDRVRAHFGLGTVTLLGHSWGGVLAMEYATRYPGHVSSLILLNTAPASRDDYLGFREAYRRRPAADLELMQALVSSDAYKAGDPDTVAAYYRIHFRTTLKPGHLDQIIERLRATFTQGGVRTAWAIEERLMQETWLAAGYDLFPRLRALPVPTLVVHGEDDLIPVEYATRIAAAIPAARFLVLPGCGHFSYLDCPDAVHAAIGRFLRDLP